MGYACPVCEDPQADAGHLANHLAFTAITSGGDHETWLDEHVPGWGQLGESELADRVANDADATEFPQVFQASGLADGRDQGDHGARGHEHHDHGPTERGVETSVARARGSGSIDDEARAILDEARALSEEMRRQAAGDGGDAESEGEGASGDDERGAADEGGAADVGATEGSGDETE